MSCITLEMTASPLTASAYPAAYVTLEKMTACISEWHNYPLKRLLHASRSQRKGIILIPPVRCTVEIVGRFRMNHFGNYLPSPTYFTVLSSSAAVYFLNGSRGVFHAGSADVCLERAHSPAQLLEINTDWWSAE